MRSDHALYAVAVILFLLTGIAALMLRDPERPLWTVTTAVLGLLFLGLGYTQRPKPHAVTIKEKPTPPAPISPVVTETVKEEKTETAVEVAPKAIALTEVKGIKEKRTAQLKALGINNVEELAKASANDLAAKLKISPKITARWIEDAKKLLQKS